MRASLRILMFIPNEVSLGWQSRDKIIESLGAMLSLQKYMNCRDRLLQNKVRDKQSAHSLGY